MQTLNDFLSWLDKIQGLSAALLVGLSCVVIGYLLRWIKQFPNNAIPIVVILWGAVAMLIIADPRATNMPARIWTMRNLISGLVIGLIAWLAHKIVLSKFEDWLASKVPTLADTSFFRKKNGEAPEDTKLKE